MLRIIASGLWAAFVIIALLSTLVQLSGCGGGDPEDTDEQGSVIDRPGHKPTPGDPLCNTDPRPTSCL